MTVHQKFVADMQRAGIGTEQYSGRFYWEGPAARSDQQHGPTLRDIIGGTVVPLQWDHVNSDYIVYPVGMAKAEWDGAAAKSEADEEEQDGYRDGYAAKPPEDPDEDDD